MNLKVKKLGLGWWLVGLVLIAMFVGAVRVGAIYNGNASGYAWSKNGGWISFENTNTFGVEVTETYLDGYAWGEKVGFISFTRDSGTPGYQVAVTINQDEMIGYLSGYAWGPQTGYIRMAASNSSYANTGATNYGVKISGETGVFSGYAWSEKLGWIKFAGSCTTGDSVPCSSGSYAVRTTWRMTPTAGSGFLESAVFDTGSESAVYNSIMWRGTQPTGTMVRFQIATSESALGPWAFVGPDNTGSSYYTPEAAGVPVKIRRENHLHDRYFRYKVYLSSDENVTVTPEVEDVIVNYTR